jgi:hypothetical protein
VDDILEHVSFVTFWHAKPNSRAKVDDILEHVSFVNFWHAKPNSRDKMDEMLQIYSLSASSLPGMPNQTHVAI